MDITRGVNYAALFMPVFMRQLSSYSLVYHQLQTASHITPWFYHCADILPLHQANYFTWILDSFYFHFWYFDTNHKIQWFYVYRSIVFQNYSIAHLHQAVILDTYRYYTLRRKTWLGIYKHAHVVSNVFAFHIIYYYMSMLIHFT